MSHDDMQPVDGDQELVDKWVVEIKGCLEKPYNSHKIGNVEEYPSIIGNWKCWDDFWASFIPEPLKWIYVACMTHYFGLNLQKYLEYMQKKVDLAWSHYREVYQFRTAENSKPFIEHLLVNSCFLIFSMILLPESEETESEEKQRKDKLINIFNENNSKGPSCNDVQSMMDFIMEDPMRTKGYLLTMNYQIPWFVVQAVYTTELSNLSNKLKLSDTHPEGTLSDIDQIAYLFCRGFQPAPFKKIDQGGTLPEGYFKHLLHIFHWSRIPDGKYLQPSRPPKWIGRFHIPSATELQLSQTVFIKNEDGFIDVSYSDSNNLCIVTCMACLPTGEMKLTPWHFFQYSIKLYKSLLRFEQWYGNQCGFPFTSYVACMASLIKTEEDVRVLRTKEIIPCCRHFAVNHQKKEESEIIPNTSFDDKAVLHCVQELRTLIDDNLRMPKELDDLEEKVKAHHQRSRYRVIGEFKKRYCSNTWIIISVIAGILVFVFTLLQTVYSMLSYYNQ